MGQPGWPLFPKLEFAGVIYGTPGDMYVGGVIDTATKGLAETTYREQWEQMMLKDFFLVWLTPPSVICHKNDICYDKRLVGVPENPFPKQVFYGLENLDDLGFKV